MSYTAWAGVAAPIRWKSRGLVEAREGGREHVEIPEDSAGQENGSVGSLAQTQRSTWRARGTSRKLEQGE